MTALESTTSDAYSNEELETQRKLKFCTYLLELTKKDPAWKATLKEKAEMFKVLDQ